uniref:Uncharacterized protein n=1 Tax=Anopheles culicifacies TaxID=139723 RepID=A0A182LXJ7_9DIPT
MLNDNVNRYTTISTILNKKRYARYSRVWGFALYSPQIFQAQTVILTGLPYRIYCYLFYFCIMALYLFALMLNVFVPQPFEQRVFFIMYISLTETAMILKTRTVYRYFDTIWNLYETTLGPSFQPRDEAERELQNRTLVVFNRWYYVYIFFSVSGLVICASAYQVASMLNLNDFSKLMNVFYMMSMTMQIGLPCYYGNEVTLKSYALTNAIYSSNWYNMKQRHRKSVQMFLVRTNKPFAATAFRSVVNVRDSRIEPKVHLDDIAKEGQHDEPE